jgi:ERCC4-type nuclease
MSAEAPPLTCPFTVLVDSREQAPYLFRGLRANADRGGLPVLVPTARRGLAVGDYSMEGFEDQIIIERKSKEDLYNSVARRGNFVGRLARMARYPYAAVVVEADWGEVLTSPPKYSQLLPKSLFRTIMAWDVRYPVKWWFVPGRDAGEATTFRLLERWWADSQRWADGTDGGAIR